MKALEIKSVEELVKLIQVVVWGFVVFVLMMVLGGIVGSMLYSVIFVTQPIKTMAPFSSKFRTVSNFKNYIMFRSRRWRIMMC